MRIDAMLVCPSLCTCLFLLQFLRLPQRFPGRGFDRQSAGAATTHQHYLSTD